MWLIIILIKYWIWKYLPKEIINNRKWTIKKVFKGDVIVSLFEEFEIELASTNYHNSRELVDLCTKMNWKVIKEKMKSISFGSLSTKNQSIPFVDFILFCFETISKCISFQQLFRWISTDYVLFNKMSWITQNKWWITQKSQTFPFSFRLFFPIIGITKCNFCCIEAGLDGRTFLKIGKKFDHPHFDLRSQKYVILNSEA